MKPKNLQEFIEPDEDDCWLQDNCVCPYCGYEDIDSWEIGERDRTSSCNRCDKIFSVEQEFSRTFSTSKTCQPGDEHNWSEWRPYIKGESEHRNCKTCPVWDYRQLESYCAPVEDLKKD